MRLRWLPVLLTQGRDVIRVRVTTRPVQPVAQTAYEEPEDTTP
jgi:hypothetical protein